MTWYRVEVQICRISADESREDIMSMELYLRNIPYLHEVTITLHSSGGCASVTSTIDTTSSATALDLVEEQVLRVASGIILKSPEAYTKPVTSEFIEDYRAEHAPDFHA